MRGTPQLIEATPTSDDHIVHVRFEDGVSANVDLSHLVELGDVFELLKDWQFFDSLRADRDAGTIVWPNQADIAPESLYRRAKPASGA